MTLVVRTRHRDHYAALVTDLDAPARTDYERRLEQAVIEMDNLRSAFGWCLENSDIEQAVTMASSLQPVWIGRGRIREGRAWFDAALTGHPSDVVLPDAVRARVLADKASLDIFVAGAASMDAGREALAIARELDDPALLARVLTGCGYTFGYNDLVVDPRSFYLLNEIGYPVVFDAGHSIRKYGIPSKDPRGSARQFLTTLARSAVAAGVDGFFIESHPNPPEALCDAASQYALDDLERFMRPLIDIHDLVRSQAVH